MEQLITATLIFVADYMKFYDSSHDMSHINRVHSLAKRIEAAEKLANADKPRCDGNIITLASLLHDVGDKKYLKPGEDGSTAVLQFLLDQGSDIDTATKVQDIVNHVSYSSEIKDPNAVAAALMRHPELAIVQDADRLDALGAIGVGRCFTFNASRAKQGAMDGAICHFKEKLERLEDLMKTKTGKAMAVERTRRIVAFREWWEEECTIV